MKKFSSDLKFLFLLWILSGAGIFLAYAHYGHLIIDCGREVYYPGQILLGKVLYKDLFNIYGPFSYMFNALLFKIFGVNLSVLYWSGIVCSFVFVSLIYKIAGNFLTRIISFAVAFFTICTRILNTNLFNFIFPYSYAMLYGMTAFLASVFFLIKYVQEPKKTLNLYLGGFFAGFCTAGKYEFLPYLLVFLYLMLNFRKLSLKQGFYLFLSIIFVPFVCFGILFLQGLEFNDLISTAVVLKNMAKSETLRYFYMTQGVIFSKKTLPFLALTFVKTVIPVALMALGFMINTKRLSVFLIIFAAISGAVFITPSSLAFLPVMLLILFILNYKKIRREPAIPVLALSAVLIGLKSFWGLTVLNYGVFFAGFLLIAVFALIKNKFYQKAIFIYIIILSLVYGLQNLSALNEKKQCIETPKGKICGEKYLTKSSSDLIDFITKKTKKTDKIVIFPEGLVINFLTDRQSDDYYNSLIPLYWEVFKDAKLIAHFEKTRPEYIIFSNWNNKDYYFKYICSDYAVDFCNFAAKNYRQEQITGENFTYLIYKKK